MVVASSCVVLVPIRAKKEARTCGVTFGKQEVQRVNILFHNSSAGAVHQLKTKAASSDRNPKAKSVICTNCDGNGAVQCSQCKGRGVNSVDMFDGQFKAGDSCWLCGGKKHMLCGDCNGAGFVGGFMSTLDE